MQAINYSTVRKYLKKYCDQATDEDEAIIVTRKKERNVVILSLKQYNQLIQQTNFKKEIE